MLCLKMESNYNQCEAPPLPNTPKCINSLLSSANSEIRFSDVYDKTIVVLSDSKETGPLKSKKKLADNLIPVNSTAQCTITLFSLVTHIQVPVPHNHMHVIQM